MINLAVVGSREYPRLDAVEQILEATSGYWDILISGGARGVDRTAEGVAKKLEKPNLSFVPNAKGGMFSYLALRRNKLIVNEADIVLAFWDEKSTGTLHSITYAEEVTDKPMYVIGPKVTPIITRSPHNFEGFEGKLWEQFKLYA